MWTLLSFFRAKLTMSAYIPFCTSLHATYSHLPLCFFSSSWNGREGLNKVNKEMMSWSLLQDRGCIEFFIVHGNHSEPNIVIFSDFTFIAKVSLFSLNQNCWVVLFWCSFLFCFAFVFLICVLYSPYQIFYVKMQTAVS